MRTRRVLVIVVAALAVALGGCAPEPAPTATPTAVPGQVDPSYLATPADPLPLADLGTFSAVVELNAGSNCTGTLIDTGVSTGPAYVLTNGHCAGGIGRSSQETATAVEGFGTATFFAAAGNEGGTVEAQVAEIAYLTMHRTDTAIVRLNTTLADLERLGVAPLRIVETEPTANTEVVNVGVPVEGLADADWVLRRGDCTLGPQRTLLESTWIWFNAWTTDCPGIVQGSSGSPLLRMNESGAPEAIVAMINTTTWGADPAFGGACSLHRPCEVGEDGVTVMRPRTSYAQSVAGVGHCFDPTTGRFHTGGECPLPLTSVWAELGGGAFRGGDEPNAFGQTPAVTLVAKTAGASRTALVPLGDGRECTQKSTYASAATVQLPKATNSWEPDGRSVPVDLPTTEGWYLLCAIRGDDLAGAATVIFEVDRTPPVFAAGAHIDRMDEGVIIRPYLVPPELAQPRYTWGDPDSTDCDDPSTFTDYRVIPLFIPAAELPAVYCVMALDVAGNASPVTRIPLDAP
ncbi:trypsin-like serine protease [Microbacterium gorillae]|uniref:trypsin-like serine protease n=1 Tax=Microbacterium gorillae TaxID=1231063 RepID=UPI00058F1A25|nr:trypsin-like serine protease [Microbacterium gorillae]